MFFFFYSVIIQNSGFLADELVYLKSLNDEEEPDTTKIPHLEEAKLTKRIRTNIKNSIVFSLDEDVSVLVNHINSIINVAI